MPNTNLVVYTVFFMALFGFQKSIRMTVPLNTVKGKFLLKYFKLIYFLSPDGLSLFFNLMRVSSMCGVMVKTYLE